MAARIQLQILTLARILIRGSCLPWPPQPAPGRHRGRHGSADPAADPHPGPDPDPQQLPSLDAALASWQRGSSCGSSPWPGSRSGSSRLPGRCSRPPGRENKAFFYTRMRVKFGLTYGTFSVLILTHPEKQSPERQTPETNSHRRKAQRTL